MAELARHVPDQIVRRFERIDVPFYRVDAWYAAERRLFGWSDRYWLRGRTRTWRPVTPVMVASKYRDALTKANRAKTLQEIGWAIDLTLHGAQVGKLEQHDTPDFLPDWQTAKAMTFPNGVIEVRDVQRPEPTCGLRSFLEATPIELVTYAFDVHATCGRPVERPLRIWDLTGGSGTISDVARSYKAAVVATDLNFDNPSVKFGPCQQVGQPPWHMRVKKVYPETFAPKSGVITTPDIVFFDPGSRGSPSVSSLYFGQHEHREVCGLGRDEYIESIAAVLRVAIFRLAAGGLISLVVREGVRDHQHVVTDPGLTEEILRRIPASIDASPTVGDVAYVVEQLKVTYVDPVKQVSLGTSRVPTVHALLARNDW